MIEKLWEMVIEQKEIIFDNYVLFITYGLLCVAITVVVTSYFNKYFNKYENMKYQKVCQELKEIKDDNVNLKKENESLKKIYSDYDILPRLRGGVNEMYI